MKANGAMEVQLHSLLTSGPDERERPGSGSSGFIQSKRSSRAGCMNMRLGGPKEMSDIFGRREKSLVHVGNRNMIPSCPTHSPAAVINCGTPDSETRHVKFEAGLHFDNSFLLT
jgi:hypothetical protein